MNTRRSPYLICLTGGVASGKTTVSDKMKTSGVEIVDTDLLSRKVVSKHSKGLDLLVSAFGKNILTADGELNRSHLRRKIFSDDVLRKKLNGIVHPLIHQEVLDAIKLSHQKIVVVVIPLYADQKEYQFFDRVCVVDTAKDTQLMRLQQRDGVTHKLALQMIESQIKRKQRLLLADDVISNKKDVSFLLKQVEEVITCYHFFADRHNEACQ